jgi:hypothetical protein
MPARHQLPSSALGFSHAPCRAIASLPAGRCNRTRREGAPPPKGRNITTCVPLRMYNKPGSYLNRAAHPKIRKWKAPPKPGWSYSQTPKSEEIQVGGVWGEPLSRGLGTRCGLNQRGDGRGVVVEARQSRSGGGAPSRSPVRSFFTYWVVLRRAAAPAWVQALRGAVGRVRSASPIH